MVYVVLEKEPGLPSQRYVLSIKTQIDLKSKRQGNTNRKAGVTVSSHRVDFGKAILLRNGAGHVITIKG